MTYALIYLLKSTIYLALFYGFFLVMMRNTTFFRLNRVMLLLGTFVCMLLPLHTVTVEKIEGIQLPMEVMEEILVLKAPTNLPQRDLPIFITLYNIRYLWIRSDYLSCNGYPFVLGNWKDYQPLPQTMERRMLDSCCPPTDTIVQLV